MGLYEEAVAEEERNRLLAYVHGAEPLIGCPVVGLTWRHVIELSLAGNAFFASREPASHDVEQVLWRLNPAFRRPSGIFPNRSAEELRLGARPPSAWNFFNEKMRCVRVAQRVSANAAERVIQLRLHASFMDRPASTADEKTPASPLLAIPTWFDYVTGEFAMWGHAREQMLDYPVAWTFQVLRVQGIKNGNAIAYIAPSAKLYKFRNQ